MRNGMQFTPTMKRNMMSEKLSLDILSIAVNHKWSQFEPFCPSCFFFVFDPQKCRCSSCPKRIGTSTCGSLPVQSRKNSKLLSTPTLRVYFNYSFSKITLLSLFQVSISWWITWTISWTMKSWGKCWLSMDNKLNSQQRHLCLIQLKRFKFHLWLCWKC